jgi:molybdopterin synthase sulfur carrier subunit
MRGLTKGLEQVRVEAATLREVVEALELAYPGVRARVVEDDRIRPGLAVSVNGEVTNEGLRTKVGADDEIHFVAAISGG